MDPSLSKPPVEGLLPDLVYRPTQDKREEIHRRAEAKLIKMCSKLEEDGVEERKQMRKKRKKIIFWKNNKHQWKVETEGFVIAVQNQCFLTRNYQSNIQTKIWWPQIQISET